jgi:hypothetical protein
MLQLANPLPGFIVGQVRADDRSGIEVRLAGNKDVVVSPGSRSVDSATGEFVIHYRTSFSDRPRKLIVAKPGCREQEQAIGIGELRATQALPVEFRCQGSG